MHNIFLLDNTVDDYEENGDGVRLKMRLMLLDELSWLLAVVE